MNLAVVHRLLTLSAIVFLLAPAATRRRGTSRKRLDGLVRIFGKFLAKSFSLFWTAVDLESKLSEFRDYYNLHRSHAGLARKTPEEPREVRVCATLKSYRWGGHCRGLFHTPIAA